MARTILRCASVARAPLDARRRRVVAASLSSPHTIPEADGFLRLPQPAGTSEVVAQCRELFRALPPLINPKKRFLVPVISGDDLNRHPNLIAYMLQPEFLHVASKYLGAVPRLAGAALWYSPTNDTEISSQRFHTDKEDTRQIKVFLAIEGIDIDCGPFTFVPAKETEEVLRGMREIDYGRLDDADVIPKAGRLERLTGPAGSLAMVDTSRCLHYGSRKNTKDRLVLMFHFLRTSAYKEPANALTASRDLVASRGWSEAQRMALAH
jgi:hypothetical protein